MTIQELFSQFKGRISRKIYINSFLFLFCLQIGISYFLLQSMGLTLETYMKKVTPHTLSFDFLSYAIFFWPTLAIGVKRLQDLGWSSGGYIILYTALVLMHLLGALQAFGIFLSDGAVSSGFKSMIGMLGLGSLAFFVIMVFFPGTQGDNKYGADPL